MTSRINKINELIRRELGSIILQGVDLSPGVLVTITRVSASPNLQQAKVYVSVMPEKKIKETMLALNRDIYGFQQKLNKRLNMRPIPKISFIEEKETREADKIEKLLEKIKKQ